MSKPIPYKTLQNKLITPWRLLESRYILQDEWLTLRADTCETQEGIKVAPYYVQEVCDWVHIVALNADGEVLLNQQYRHGSQRICLELPSGGVERGETPAAAAQRELLEETGHQAAEWVALPSFYPNPAGLTNKIYPFLAYGVEQVQAQELDPGEEIVCSFMPVEELCNLIWRGEFPQALHVATLMVALERAGFLKPSEKVRAP
ncbi:MAG: NUDIX hydrolase [Pseudomonadota bacterium]